MNGLLSRVLQRATHPGGGLEPLRTSRAGLRARVASSMTFPAEEVREVDARVPIAGSAVERTGTSTRPILPIPAKAIGDSFTRVEERESAALHAVPHQRVKQPSTNPVESASAREAFANHEAANTIVATVGGFPEHSAAGAAKELQRERSERSEPETSKSPTTREQMLAVTSRHGMEDQEALNPQESHLPPILEISIGHIEVQAAVRAPERPRTPPFRPRVSLNDFLTRSGRR